jgi:hypothetical protein
VAAAAEVLWRRLGTLVMALEAALWQQQRSGVSSASATAVAVAVAAAAAAAD